MSVQRAQHEITSSEFLDWIVYLDEDINGFHRGDYFLAQIAQEIRRSFVSEPDTVKLEPFLIKFETKKKEKKKKLTKEEATRRMKSYWGTILKNPNKRKKK